MNKILFKYFLTIVSFNIFMLVYNPLLIRLLLIIITIIIIINSYNININLWFSYILCLIYLGGVLILFIYISSFLPNIKITLIPLTVLILFWLVLVPLFNFNNLIVSYFINNNYLSINIIFEKNIIMFFILSIFYLIVTLIITVYYSSFNKIPLRRVF